MSHILQKPKVDRKSIAKPTITKRVKVKEIRKENIHEKLKELKTKLATVELELDVERKQRNKLQLERDKVEQFWQTAKAQTKKIQDEAWKRDLIQDDKCEKLQKEVSFLNEKISFLLRDQERQNMQMTTTNQDGGDNIRESKIDNFDVFDEKTLFEQTEKNLLLEKEKEIQILKGEYEKTSRLREEAFKQQLEHSIKQLTQKFNEETRKMQLDKLRQFDEMLIHHQQQIEILQTTFDQDSNEKDQEINTLRKSFNDAKEKLKKVDEEISEEKREKTNLQRQVEILNKSIDNLSIDLSKSKANEKTLHICKNQLKQTKMDLIDWKEKYQLLYDKSIKIEKERDRLETYYKDAVDQIQQQTFSQKIFLNQQISQVEKNLKKHVNEPLVQ